MKDAGKTLIQVTDNGCGMSVTDARLAFERHATSKITSVDDLFAIRTMGFRGEAMASIAAIAQVELRTKKTAEELGTCVTIEGSEVKNQEFCQCPQGTTIMVKNLFYNVPARRKFLKSNNVELRHILEEFQRVALACPNIAFSMFNDRRAVFQLKPSTLKQRIVAIFGQHFNQRLLPVEQTMDMLTISGFVGKPEHAKKARGEQYFFVNNRFMRHAYLNHAVDSAFEELIPENAHPGYFIFFEINPKEIDINIHPTKTEIKFQDERLVYSVLRSAVKSALGKFSVTPSLDFEVEPAFDFKTPPKGTPVKPPQIKINPNFNPFEKNQGLTSGRESSNRKNWEKLYTDNKDSDFPSGKDESRSPGSGQMQADLGVTHPQESNFFQLHNRFILSQVKSGLMVIDQQKAHERILFERYLELLGSQQSLSQQELFPIGLSLSPDDAELLYEIMEDLNLLGFSIKPDEKKSFHFLIDGTPADLRQGDPVELIEGVIESYKNNLIQLNLDKKINLARSLAKNMSIRHGRVLQQSEMKAVIESLFSCKVPELSIDGDPVVRVITLDELAGKQAKNHEQNKKN
ncbi:MAG: DNA mismatch repair endonuclease MutL [Bacteroidota bacterium]